MAPPKIDTKTITQTTTRRQALPVPAPVEQGPVEQYTRGGTVSADPTLYRNVGPQASANWLTPPGVPKVILHSATAKLPGGRIMAEAGLYHQWITTSNGVSAGMGNMRGVPGENGQRCPDMPFSPTQIVDHTGRQDRLHREIHGVDIDALESWLQPGRPTGPWTPVLNDCNSTLANIIELSTPHSMGGTSFGDSILGRQALPLPPMSPSTPVLKNVVVPLGQPPRPAINLTL